MVDTDTPHRRLLVFSYRKTDTYAERRRGSRQARTEREREKTVRERMLGQEQTNTAPAQPPGILPEFSSTSCRQSRALFF